MVLSLGWETQVPKSGSTNWIQPPGLTHESKLCRTWVISSSLKREITNRSWTRSKAFFQAGGKGLIKFWTERVTFGPRISVGGNRLGLLVKRLSNLRVCSLCPSYSRDSHTYAISNPTNSVPVGIIDFAS